MKIDVDAGAKLALELRDARGPRWAQSGCTLAAGHRRHDARGHHHAEYECAQERTATHWAASLALIGPDVPPVVPPQKKCDDRAD